MEHHIQSGDSTSAGPSPARRGFSLVEVMVVASIIVILIAMALPMYTRSIVRSRESVLASNLYTLRTVIQHYSYDKAQAPQSLEDLVSAGYLRAIPIDPMTNAANWHTATGDSKQTAGQGDAGIGEVHSASGKTGLDGRPYSEW